ncbi:MAG TPA: tetratricopeptide repeat protein [Labilithrix sp.]
MTEENKPEDEKTDSDEKKEKVEDSATPEAIARRVAALGEEDQLEVLAREEEKKLAERRAQKKGKKKTGLEQAASKKLAKIGTRAEPRRTVAVAADADPLIERTAKLSDWAKKNQKTVQIVGALIAVGLLSTAGWLYWQQKQETEASVMLAKAVADERGRIGEPPKDDEEPDPTPIFKTFEARRDAALAKYKDVESKFPKTGAAILARLAEGSLLLDKKDGKGAASAFEDVKNSPLAAADAEVRGRALEGLGFAYELDGKLDDAMKAYKELENTDVRGFKELAMYHQARVAMAKGDKDKAKELLVATRDRLQKPEESAGASVVAAPPFPYLNEMATDRLREIDPSAVPKTQIHPGAAQMSPGEMKKRLEEAMKKAKAGGQ